MKLSTQSSASLYSYLPPTPNILLSQTLNLCTSLDVRHQISQPHNMTGTMSVLYISTSSILNWMAASIAWFYSTLFSRSWSFSKFCHNLPYLKPDLLQSDSGTSQAMWPEIQNP